MRLLHTMLRVGNLAQSVKFYTEVLGMTVLREEVFPDAKFNLVFLGYGTEAENTVLELTYNWGTETYELGNAYGHIAIAVENAAQACEKIKQLGGKVVREAGPMMDSPEVIAFIEDPDGYKVELIERD